MVVHFVKRFWQIKSREADSEATRDVAINSRSYGVYSVETAKPPFKDKLFVAGCKVRYIKVK